MIFCSIELLIDIKIYIQGGGGILLSTPKTGYTKQEDC